ncbi:MAG: chemotaxis protein CheW [Acidobacteria bacterium]|nr:chemotaxis protein CheW [Acidobacteriota bacterium]
MSQNTVSSTSQRLIRCAVGTQTCCLELALVQSVQRAELMQPNLSEAGPIGWLPGKNQSSIPVWRLATRLGLPADPKNQTGSIMVLHHKSHPWALMVDRMMGIVDAPVDTILPVPEMVDRATNHIFRGIVRVEQELILYLEPERLHPEEVNPLPVITDRQLSPHSKTSATSTASKQRKGQILLFSVGTESPFEHPITFGLSITQVAEILERPAMTRIPMAPKHILGLVNWRNQPVPAIDFGHLFGLGAALFEENTRLLIARTSASGELVAIPIQPSVKVQSLPLPYQPSRKEIPVNTTLAKGIFTLRNETLVIPDMNAFGGC